MTEAEGGDDQGFAITLRDFDPDALDIQALARGIAEAARHVPDMDRVAVVVCGNFEGYVRSTEKGEMAEHYRQERLVGGARAKVIDRGDGYCELLVDAAVVDRDRDPEVDPTGVFVHEALHIAAGQRGETLTGRRARLGYRLGSADGMVAGLAGMAAEEFRVVRALAELGRPLDAAYSDELVTVVDAYRGSLRAPLEHWDRTGDVEDLAEAVLRGFEYVMTIVAYLVADDVASDGARRPDLERLGSSRWLGRSYAALRAALAPLPSALQSTPREELDELCDAVEDALVDWLTEIGFAIEDVPGGLFLEVLDVEDLEGDLAA